MLSISLAENYINVLLPNFQSLTRKSRFNAMEVKRSPLLMGFSVRFRYLLDQNSTEDSEANTPRLRQGVRRSPGNALLSRGPSGRCLVDRVGDAIPNTCDSREPFVFDF